MIEIWSTSDVLLYEVPETSACEKVEELMSSDYIRLSWNSPTGEIIPAGSYIEFEDEVYTLLEDYHPQQKMENHWYYEPQFESSVMAWKKTPFFMYTVIEGEITNREIDWSLTGNAALFLDRIKTAIKNETGETYTYDPSAPEGSKTLTFNATDIISALNSIANAFETEWWIDKENKVIHLSTCNRGGTPVTLEVGENINVPSISENTEGFYNRFYIFGSTRNIVQSYNGANVNNLVNKRLTLNPDDYPDGYYEPYGTQDKVLSKVLIFDDIYPAATQFEIYDIESRLDYVLDDTGKKILIGTDSSGNPVYDMYAVYYFKIGTPTTGGGHTQFFLNAWNYSDKPERQGGSQPGLSGMLIEGLNVSVSFTSGNLQGREFEVRYIKENETITSPDGTAVTLTPGYFEIKYSKEGDYIIPDLGTLVPSSGDKATLFNIKMPDAYIEDAYDRLEEKMLETIEEKYTSDRNTYTCEANAVAFHSSNPHLKIGTSVKYKNGDYTLTTRVTRLATKIDFSEKQTITMGNSLVKGTIQELKEEVTSANRNIDVIGALNDSTKALVDAYTRAQQTLIEQMSRLGNLFIIEDYTEDGVAKQRLKLNPAYMGLYADGFLTAGGIGSGGGGGTDVSWTDRDSNYGVLTITGTGHNVSLYGHTHSQYLLSSQKGVANGVAELDSAGKIPTSQLPSYVSDVIECSSRSAFPATGESNKIYVAKDTNLTYRWSGTTYVEISPSIALGTTSETAYYGDKGKIAYDHSQITSGNPHGVTFENIGGNLTAAQIPALSASKITSGTFGTARIADEAITLAKLSSGVQTSLGKADTALQSVAFSDLTSHPTTLSGYGITNAYTKTEVDNRDITAVSLTASKLTLTRASGNLEASVPTWNQDTTGNAASATKLKTARNLWGNSFNGTAAVSGALTFTAVTTASTTAHLEVITIGGVTYLHTRLPFYSDESVSAGGIGTGGGGGGTDVSWTDVDSNYGRLTIAGTAHNVSVYGHTHSQYMLASQKGANNGVAELDSAGKIPVSQLPSYVSDVLEYASQSAFPTTGEGSKIYVAKDTNKTYRWTGSAYVEISPSIALGETSATAYRGDRGAIAYSHSQTTTGNPHNVTFAQLGGSLTATQVAAAGNLTNDTSGNAATASKLTNFEVKSYNNTSTTCDDLIGTCGIFRMSGHTASGTPDSGGYGQLLSIFGGGDTYAQFYFGYYNDADRNIFFRGGSTTSTAAAHKTWHHVLHDGNFVAGTNYQSPISDLSTIRSNASTAYSHSQITSGNPHGVTFANIGGSLTATQIPSLAASKITSGTFDAARIPTLAISKISGLQTALDGKLSLTGGTVTGAVSFQDNITLSNGKYINALTSGGVSVNLMRLNTSDNLVIGYGSATNGGNTYLYGDSVRLYYGTSPVAGLTLTNGGNVGIGTTSPDATLTVSGTAHVTGNASFDGNINLSTNQKALNVVIDGTSMAAISTTASVLMLGRGTVNNGKSTYIYGNNVYVKYGSNTGVGITLTSEGKVGIGTDNTSPSAPLDVLSPDLYAVKLRRSNANNGAFIKFENTNSSTPNLGAFGYYKTSSVAEFRWYNYTTQSATTTIATLTGTGNFVAIGQVTAGTASDIRFKSNVETMKMADADAILAGLRPVEFDWNDLGTELSGNKGHDTGLIAQEVCSVFPYAVSPIYERYLRVDYAKLTPILVVGWQSHETEIETLKRRIKHLEDKLAQYVKN